MEVIKKWKNQFKNEMRKDDNVITLSGVIDSGWYGDISAEDVRKLLDGVEGDVTIKLNSPGGSAFEGIEIYNTLKDFPNKVTVEVTALAASAATFLCMAADEVVMCTGSQMMIHNAWTFTSGNADQLISIANDLRTIDNSIKEIYSERTGLDIATIEGYMQNERLWSAEETIEKGFAHRKKNVSKKESEDSVNNEHLMNMIASMNEQIKALQEQIEQNNKKNDLTDEQEDGSIFVPENKLKKLFGGK
mgnify:CR=1 FL=1